ncbi:protein required for normal CLN1 and CLN2 G1 cyclin expression [Malassezia sp. CBS 17886]|nr:protein required for normal CLN1 and CLN2 G1 cyclin expression [Malassezia sp. CBS 17886]
MGDAGGGGAMSARAPRSLELVLATNESIVIELEPLPSAEELEVVVDMLVEEKPPAYFWTALAARCWAAGRRREAELIVSRGCSILATCRPEESVALFALQAAFHLADARTAPKQVLDDARFQPLAGVEPKQHYYRQAAAALSEAHARSPQHAAVVRARAAFALVTGDNALAARLFDVLLARHASDAVALLGRACILLRERQYMAALHAYQAALRLALATDQHAARVRDDSLRWAGPDARVGIGLCLWGLGRHDAARRAWRRAVDADARNHAPRLLLGMSLVNAARQATALPRGWYGAPGGDGAHDDDDREARRAAYAEGVALLQAAWHADKTCALTAVGLAAHLASQAMHAWSAALPAVGDFSAAAREMPPALEEQVATTLARALKVAEHAVQYADSRSSVVQAWLQYAHALHLVSALPRNRADHALRLLAQRYYARANEELARLTPRPVYGDLETLTFQLAHGLALSTLGLAQLQAATGDPMGAGITLDAVLSRPSVGSSASFTVELGLFAALLRAQPPPGAPAEEARAALRPARVLLDRTLRVTEAARLLAHGARADDEHDADARLDDGAPADGALRAVETALAGEALSPATLAALARLGGDARVYAVLASLVAHTDVERAVRLYVQALRAAPPPLQAALQVNIGALLVMHGAALTHAAGVRRVNEGALRRGIAYLERAFVGGGGGEGGAAPGGAPGNARGEPNGGPDVALSGAAAGTAERSPAAAASGTPERTASAPSAPVKVIANYDIGRAYEALGNYEYARDAYEALLAAHPEYVDARVRLAVLAAEHDQDAVLAGGRSARDTANSRFKEALSSDPANLDTRAAYLRFLAGEHPANRQPAWAAMKEMSAQLFLGSDAGKSVFGSAAAARRAAEEARHDPSTLAVLGWTYYQLGLHAAPGPNQRADRTKSMLRAADLLDKALVVHPQCVFAAQGLAILLADDALGDPGAAPDAVEERRRVAAADAIALFGKLREVRDDASVYVCQGHAFMIRSELERALHVYELAMSRYGNTENAAILQYVARAEYALGLREKEFAHFRAAIAHLDTAGAALAVRAAAHPQGSAAVEQRQIAYNRAVMAQKALQMLYELGPAQATPTDLQCAVAWVSASQSVLESLVDAARAGQLLYITAEVVEQRVKYAETSLLRQAQKQLDESVAHEEREREQLQRLADKQRAKEEELEQLRRAKEDELRRRAEAIAESRRRAREEASRIEYFQEPSPEPKKRAGGGRAGAKPRRRPAAESEEGVGSASESDADEGLFEESEESDADAQSGEEGGDAVDGEEAGSAAHNASAPANPMRAKLDALAQQRKERNSTEKKRPKKRRSAADPSAAVPKKPKVSANETIESDEEMLL